MDQNIKREGMRFICEIPKGSDYRIFGCEVIICDGASEPIMIDLRAPEKDFVKIKGVKT